MEYVAMSASVADEITLADGTRLPPIIGGAGSYALAGMKIWHDNVGLVTGVGTDYTDLFGDWYARNGLSVDGLIVKDDHTPHTSITYFEDGEREETPVYGPEHFRRLEGTPGELARFTSRAKGVYVFRDCEEAFWEEVLALQDRVGFRLMWELSADSALPAYRGQVERIARRLDILSINGREAADLLGMDSPEKAIPVLLEWGLPMIYLRIGARGAYVLHDGQAVHIPSVPDCMVVDVTGGGNSASGGALVGFCETGSPVTAGYMGAISASFCIAQRGVPEAIDSEMRRRAQALLDNMTGA